MATDVERALWAFEESVDEVLSFVKGASYGLRLASKRVGDISAVSPGLTEASAESAAELELLKEALEHGEDRLSGVVVLALGDHFRAFLARSLDLEKPPPLPETATEVEELAGTPGALADPPEWLGLMLQLYRVQFLGGRLDRRALTALGTADLELHGSGGKVKLFRQGDRVTLSEAQLQEVADTLVRAAKAIKLRLMTA